MKGVPIFAGFFLGVLCCSSLFLSEISFLEASGTSGGELGKMLRVVYPGGFMHGNLLLGAMFLRRADLI
jgi:hypothetical protein